uniref:[RNA-polymerase]-subunit kinase n=1 Tax=Aegilops tauschii TaxID=37682 RepID=M8BV70_AEGTA
MDHRYRPEPEPVPEIGQGTYSNVYKARDTVSGKIVALKKVRFDNLEPESVRFMAREILILRRLDHPSVIKIDGLVTSRMSCSLYLVFEYMEHDLAGLVASPDIKFTEPQVKCYMNQLLSGLEHCHDRGVLHRDIKGSNLLLDNNGMLKIADFGLASFFDPSRKQPMTSRVVTLWYRPPELLLGATDYGVGVDLWSAGCILAELLAGRPIMPGRTEPQQPYKRRITDTFKDFPQSALRLIETLLAIDPADRLTASSALRSDFFTTEPYACEPSSLPKYPPSKEMDAKRRDEEARRSRAAGGRPNGDGASKARTRDRPRGAAAPEANAELQKRRIASHANAKSKSEKFPPPHQDGAVGFPLGSSNQMDPLYEPPDPTSFSTVFSHEKSSVPTWSGPLVNSSAVGNQKRKHKSSRSSKQPSTARARCNFELVVLAMFQFNLARKLGHPIPKSSQFIWPVTKCQSELGLQVLVFCVQNVVFITYADAIPVIKRMNCRGGGYRWEEPGGRMGERILLVIWPHKGSSLNKASCALAPAEKMDQQRT